MKPIGVKHWLAAAGLIVSLVFNSYSWAIAVDDRLSPIVDNGLPNISFTDIAIEWTVGAGDSAFIGLSTNTSTFTLFGPGYDGGVSFFGSIEISANISSRGVLRSGSTFDLTSSDPIFGFGTEGLVFGGDLSDFGWSGTDGVLEFATENHSGWAQDMWGDNSFPQQRLMLRTDPFDPNLNPIYQADGIATVGASISPVVPIPAAIWLFGSGLLGLVGMSRRKKAA